MFDRIKKAFSKEGAAAPETASPSSQLAGGPLSEWAATQGFAFSLVGSSTLQVEGKAAGKRWRMELGKPSRKFIRGEELRARAELGIDEEVGVLVMNRPLKEALEKQAYAMYTDSLQTTADPNLPEEMRWLAMYDEVGWDSVPRPFWQRYAVLSARREQAQSWIDSQLATLLMDWPQAQTAQTPFILMLLRGKAYLRMECGAADLQAVQHASFIFSHACESAVGAFGADIPL